MAVCIEWYQGGDANWAQMSVAILFVYGTLCGLALGAILDDPTRTQMCPRLGPIVLPCLLCGWLGLAPAILAAVALRDGAAGETQRLSKDLQWVITFGLLELGFETLPQSILQTSIGVSYGNFESGSDGFSALMVVSVSISFLAGGTNAFGAETMGRNRDGLPPSHHIRLLSSYGLASVIARAALLGALVFGCSLWACAFAGWAVFAAVGAIIVVVWYTIEARCRSGSPDGFVVQTENPQAALEDAFLPGSFTLHYSAQSAVADEALAMADDEAPGRFYDSTRQIALATTGRPLGSLAALVAVYQALTHRVNDYATPGQPRWLYSYVMNATHTDSIAVGDLEPYFAATYYIWQPSETADALNDHSNAENYDFSTLQLPPGGSWSTPYSIQCDARSGGIFPLALFTVLFIVAHATSLTLDPEWGLRASDEKRATLRQQYLLACGNRR